MTSSRAEMFMLEAMKVPLSVAEAHAALDDHWSPKIVACVNDHLFKVAKVHGSLAWHKHDDGDELFLVTKGRLRIEFEDRDAVELGAGELFVVPRGVMHNPVAQEECWIVLMEAATTEHTGDIVTDRTKSIDEQLA